MTRAPAIGDGDLTRRHALLDLTLTNKEELVANTKSGSSLGCSDQEMVEFRILRETRYITVSQPQTSGEQTGLFMDLLRRIPWDMVLKNPGNYFQTC